MPLDVNPNFTSATKYWKRKNSVVPHKTTAKPALAGDPLSS